MKAKIVLCDDDGNVLPNSSSTAYDFELGGQTLGEIEQAVEQLQLVSDFYLADQKYWLLNLNMNN